MEQMQAGRVFDGVRIVELAQYVFVPGAGALFANLGAEVIKVEATGSGDPYRSLVVSDGRESATANFAMELNNNSKSSISIDLKDPEGREILLKLIETADVFLTSLRPRALKSLGLDVEDLRKRNPKIIYARGNGVGFEGPESEKAGYDASAFWARGGFAHALSRPDGSPPVRSRPALGDHASSVGLALGIAAALFKRERTGEPSLVETSLLANALWLLSADVTYSQVETYRDQSPLDDTRFPLMSSYQTKDGRWIQLMLLAPDRYWPEICAMLDLHNLVDDPRFANSAVRIENGLELTNRFREVIGARNWEGDLKLLFERWNAPWELINTIREVTRDPQVLANDMLYDLKMTEDVSIKLVSGPVRLDGRASPDAPRPAPSLGEHTDFWLEQIGHTQEEIAHLRASGVVQ